MLGDRLLGAPWPPWPAPPRGTIRAPSGRDQHRGPGRPRPGRRRGGHLQRASLWTRSSARPRAGPRRRRVVETVGVRFADLGLPRGAVVRRAWIQFTADEVQTTDRPGHRRPRRGQRPQVGPNEFNLSSGTSPRPRVLVPTGLGRRRRSRGRRTHPRSAGDGPGGRRPPLLGRRHRRDGVHVHRYRSAHGGRLRPGPGPGPRPPHRLVTGDPRRMPRPSTASPPSATTATGGPTRGGWPTW